MNVLKMNHIHCIRINAHIKLKPSTVEPPEMNDNALSFIEFTLARTKKPSAWLLPATSHLDKSRLTLELR